MTTPNMLAMTAVVATIAASTVLAAGGPSGNMPMQQGQMMDHSKMPMQQGQMMNHNNMPMQPGNGK